MQENNQNNNQNQPDQVNPYQGQPGQQGQLGQQGQPPYQGQPQQQPAQPSQPYQGQPQQGQPGQPPYQGQPQQQGQPGQPPYQGQPQQQGQPGQPPYQGQPQQQPGQPPYQGQPQQQPGQPPYQGQPQQQPGQPPYQAPPAAKPKGPNPFGQLFSKLFSKQPYDAFKVKQDYLSIFVIIGAAIILLALATSFSTISLYFFRFFGPFFASLIGIIIVYGVQLGYGILIQGKEGTTNQKMMTSLEVMATASIFPVAFYFLALLFSFFWYSGYSLFLLIGFVMNIVLLLDGFDVRLGEKSRNLWFRLGFIFVAILFYVFLVTGRIALF